MEHIIQHDAMRIARCSLKTLRNAWVAVVLLLEIGIFIAASAQCHWPDPGVSAPSLSHHPLTLFSATQLSLPHPRLLFFYPAFLLPCVPWN